MPLVNFESRWDRPFYTAATFPNEDLKWFCLKLSQIFGVNWTLKWNTDTWLHLLSPCYKSEPVFLHFSSTFLLL